MVVEKGAPRPIGASGLVLSPAGQFYCMATTRTATTSAAPATLDLDLTTEQAQVVATHIQTETAHALGVVVSRIVDWVLGGNICGSLKARVKALAWATGYGPMTGNGSMADSADDCGISRSAMQQLVARCREHLAP